MVEFKQLAKLVRPPIFLKNIGSMSEEGRLKCYSCEKSWESYGKVEHLHATERSSKKEKRYLLLINLIFLDSFENAQVEIRIDRLN